ncbi:hypothetical protein NDU88_005179 [Pleurodeles waltl]|uniref:Uncharacterized protein n=1 Tax=Pleurodeles waltl TaxID=8319 RepID=A0AAV7VJ79_PLEWA|nr:hypothetical protein NDU88_005179 [Pleurodeles waltl]
MSQESNQEAAQFVTLGMSSSQVCLIVQATGRHDGPTLRAAHNIPPQTCERHALIQPEPTPPGLVHGSTVTEEQIFDQPVSDLDVKQATPMPPAVSLKLQTPENQQSETEAQVLKDVIFPTKTKDLNVNLVFEDLMSTVLSVLLQETIINSKARAEPLDKNVKAISEEIPVLFLSKEQPFSGNRVEDHLTVAEPLCKEIISDTTNTPQSTVNEEIPVLSEDHPKELACGTSTFSDVNPVSKDMKTLVAPEFDTPKSSKTKENSDFFMFTLRTPVPHISQVSMLCKPQATTNANTAAETDISCLLEGVTDLTVTKTPIISSKEESIEQETNVLKNTTHNAIPDLIAPESTSPETNSMHSSHSNRTIKRKDIGAHMGINTCFAHWKIHLRQDCKLIDQEKEFGLRLAGRVHAVKCMNQLEICELLGTIRELFDCSLDRPRGEKYASETQGSRICAPAQPLIGNIVAIVSTQLTGYPKLRNNAALN